ncbi:hypothetical protein GOV05_03190 [Candidatus Woesearchaeota archaeon]|nr:hypothetical protein [Candidatus Woesearchaeota archaeon]
MASKKKVCPTCHVAYEEGHIATNTSYVFWTKGTKEFFKTLFRKAQPITCYSCPNCGKMDFYRKIKK